MRSPKVSKKAKCHLDLALDLDLDQQHMLTSLAAGKKCLTYFQRVAPEPVEPVRYVRRERHVVVPIFLGHP